MSDRDDVDLGGLEPVLRHHDYPVPASALVEEFGSVEVTCADEAERLETVLHRADERLFYTTEEIEEAVSGAFDE